MTGMLAEWIDFGSWHYRRDPTHVVFYQRTTLRYLAQQYGWRCEFPGQDVALMRKPERPGKQSPTAQVSASPRQPAASRPPSTAARRSARAGTR